MRIRAGLQPVSDGTDESVEAETPTIPEADRFHILQTSRRREAIRYLLEADDPVQLPDLARHVAASEYDTSVTEVTNEQYQRVYIPLYQSHLPSLEEHDVIEYDKSRGVVRPTDRLEVFRLYLEPDFSREGTTQRTVDPYIAVTGLSGFLLVAVTVGLLSIPGLALGAIIIFMFLVANVVARRRIATAESKP